MYINVVMISALGEADGGRETWLKNFLREIGIQKRPCKFNFFTLPKASPNILAVTDPTPEIMGSTTEFECKRGRFPIPLKFMMKALKSDAHRYFRNDYLLAVGSLNEALAALLLSRLKTPKSRRILWLRTIYTKEKGYRLNRITQKILLIFEIYIIRRFFGYVIANGNDTALFYRSKGLHCDVIENAADLKKWNKINSQSSDKIRIAFIGRLTKVKGIEAYLQAIRLLKESNSSHVFEFYVVGDGPFRESVESMASGGLLTYYGAIPNDCLPSFLENIDVCVALTFLYDFMGGGGLSNALIEQMAAKKIIIAWDNDIFNKILSPDSAYLVEHGSPTALANALERISDERIVAGKKAVEAEKLSRQYSVENHVKRFFELITSHKVD